MADDTMDSIDLVECPVCGGDGFVECDDGSEIQCDRCEGTGRVPSEGEPAADE